MELRSNENEAAIQYKNITSCTTKLNELLNNTKRTQFVKFVNKKRIESAFFDWGAFLFIDVASVDNNEDSVYKYSYFYYTVHI